MKRLLTLLVIIGILISIGGCSYPSQVWYPYPEKIDAEGWIK